MYLREPELYQLCYRLLQILIYVMILTCGNLHLDWLHGSNSKKPTNREDIQNIGLCNGLVWDYYSQKYHLASQLDKGLSSCSFSLKCNSEKNETVFLNGYYYYFIIQQYRSYNI